jgi:hypothetical protein
LVESDIAAGTLVLLDVNDMQQTGFMLTMSAFHPASAPPGPAGSWFIDHFKASSADARPSAEHR